MAGSAKIILLHSPICKEVADDKQNTKTMQNMRQTIYPLRGLRKG